MRNISFHFIQALVIGLMMDGSSHAQNVGIGTSTPGTKLTINGAWSSTPSSAAAAATVTIPANVSVFRLTLVGGVQANALSAASPQEGQYLTIYNEDDQPATFAGVSIQAGTGAGSFVYLNGAWRQIALAPTPAGWYVSGNSGTNPSANFVGTIDNQPLLFRINDQAAGRLSTTNAAFGHLALANINTTGTDNAAFGKGALNATTSGTRNTASGTEALYSTTTSSYNCGMGYRALYANTTGQRNTASGAEALRANTTGNYNAAFGAEALYSNTTAANNTGLGYRALYANTTGAMNTAIGNEALAANTTANSNTAVGYRALYANTTGAQNIAIGHEVLRSATTANNNIGIGYQALYNNNTGISNVAIGSYAMQNNTTGYHNSALGLYALSSTTVGYHNTALGHYAMAANVSGNSNTTVGSVASDYNDASSSCCYFGYDADQDVLTDFSNSMALGVSSRMTASNQVRIGNSSVTSIGGFANWTNVSDGRYKQDVQENVPGLDFITRLRPVTYRLKVEELGRFLGEWEFTRQRYDVENFPVSHELKTARVEKEKILYTGFIAQEVEQAAREVGFDFSGVDRPQNEHSLYGLRYAEFVVPLVKAVQELNEQNQQLREAINRLDAENALLKKQVASLLQQQ